MWGGSLERSCGPMNKNRIEGVAEPGVWANDREALVADTPGVWEALDQWLRHRIRAIQLKPWKRGSTAYRELRKLGASSEVAARVAANTRRWRRSSGRLLNSVLDMQGANQLGNPRLCGPQLLEPPDAHPHVRWCGRGERATAPPMPIAADSRCGAKIGGLRSSSEFHGAKALRWRERGSARLKSCPDTKRSDRRVSLLCRTKRHPNEVLPRTDD